MSLTKNIATVLCSVQRALLGKITPNLRAVYVIINDDTLEVCFYYDQHLSEHEEELASLADTEIIADFPSPFFKTKFDVQTLASPQQIQNNGICVFHRYE
jgi:hypothetical protein